MKAWLICLTLGVLPCYGQDKAGSLMSSPSSSESTEVIDFFAPPSYSGKHQTLIEKAKNNDAQAQFILAKHYEQGVELEQDTERAVYWYLQCIDNGNQGGRAELARFAYKQLQHSLSKKDEKSVWRWVNLSARHGNALAQYKLGELYALGDGVQKNFEKAEEWLQKAIDQGNSDATYSLAELLLDINNPGRKKNINRAIALIEKSAESDNLNAMYFLGYIYSKGVLVPKNREKSFSWYERSAKKGDKRSQAALGLFYALKSSQANYKTAVNWFEKAAKQGDTDSQFNIGLMYHMGWGVIQNLSKAVEWYEQAAKQDQHRAQLNLANMYFYGSGVEKNQELAEKWYEQYKKEVRSSAKGKKSILFLQKPTFRIANQTDVSSTISRKGEIMTLFNRTGTYSQTVKLYSLPTDKQGWQIVEFKDMPKLGHYTLSYSINEGKSENFIYHNTPYSYFSNEE